MISFHFHVYDSFCAVPFCTTQRSPWWLKRSVLDPPGTHSVAMRNSGGQRTLINWEQVMFLLVAVNRWNIISNDHCHYCQLFSQQDKQKLIWVLDILFLSEITLLTQSRRSWRVCCFSTWQVSSMFLDEYFQPWIQESYRHICLSCCLEAGGPHPSICSLSCIRSM